MNNEREHDKLMEEARETVKEMIDELAEERDMDMDEDVYEQRRLSIDYTVMESSLDEYGEPGEEVEIMEQYQIGIDDAAELTLDQLLNRFVRLLHVMGYSYVEELIAKKQTGYLVCNGYEHQTFDEALFSNVTNNTTTGYIYTKESE